MQPILAMTFMKSIFNPCVGSNILVCCQAFLTSSWQNYAWIEYMLHLVWYRLLVYLCKYTLLYFIFHAEYVSRLSYQASGIAMRRRGTRCFFAAHVSMFWHMGSDLCNHYPVNSVRGTKIVKSQSQINNKRNNKPFNLQEFCLSMTLIILSLLLFQLWHWKTFHSLLKLLLKDRIKNRYRPWFSPQLSSANHNRDKAWSKARPSDIHED